MTERASRPVGLALHDARGPGAPGSVLQPGEVEQHDHLVVLQHPVAQEAAPAREHGHARVVDGPCVERRARRGGIDPEHCHDPGHVALELRGSPAELLADRLCGDDPISQARARSHPMGRNPSRCPGAPARPAHATGQAAPVVARGWSVRQRHSCTAAYPSRTSTVTSRAARRAQAATSRSLPLPTSYTKPRTDDLSGTNGLASIRAMDWRTSWSRSLKASSANGGLMPVSASTPAFTSSSVTTPPALRMTCASPSPNPSMP